MPPLTAISTRAQQAAESNLNANRAALARTHSDLLGLLESIRIDVEWVFGRDGSLTARHPTGRWLGGCSLPMRASQRMLEKLEVKGAVACFLAPTHAAQVRVALDRMRPEQAIVVLAPVAVDAAAMLACEDFSLDIASNRLWFVAGDEWGEQFLQLFERHSGLAPPAQFIRVAASDAELIDRLITDAQRIIGELTQRRASDMQALRARRWRRPDVMRQCVVASRRFRLWNDAGHVLCTAAEAQFGLTCEGGWSLFDADNPASSSPLALANAVRECSVIVTANTARSDLSGIVPEDMPWLTWVTTARTPVFVNACDALIVADPRWAQAAQQAGWPASRIHVAGWPAAPLAERLQRDKFIAIVSDTHPLDPPAELRDYSSRCMLWNSIRDELVRDPLALGRDVQDYFDSTIHRLGLSDGGMPRGLFIRRLIVPAYQQGLARLLLGAGVRLFGQGWTDIADLAPNAAGPVESREQLHEILSTARAILHVWPDQAIHPLDFMGAPILLPHGLSRATLFGMASQTKVVTTETASVNAPPLDGCALAGILAKI